MNFICIKVHLWADGTMEAVFLHWHIKPVVYLVLLLLMYSFRYTTLSYRAPEMVNLYNNQVITTKSDVWVSEEDTLWWYHDKNARTHSILSNEQRSLRSGKTGFYYAVVFTVEPQFDITY